MVRFGKARTQFAIFIKCAAATEAPFTAHHFDVVVSGFQDAGFRPGATGRCSTVLFRVS